MHLPNYYLLCNLSTYYDGRLHSLLIAGAYLHEQYQTSRSMPDDFQEQQKFNFTFYI